MKYQGVDANDIETGPLQKKDLPGSIHRRVALLLLDENQRVLALREGDGWSVPHEAVPFGQSSERTARELLHDLGFDGSLRPLGGILQLREKYSTQTHVFLGRWNGQSPRREPWEGHSLPLPKRHTGAYKSFADEALRGKPRSMRISEDLR